MPLKLYLSASCQEDNLTADGHTEEEIMQDLAHDVGAQIGGLLAIRYNRPEMSLSQVVNDSNTWRPDFHLALHSNASGTSGKARGSEAWVTKLHHDGYGGAGMADLILEKLSALGFNIRRGKEGDLHKVTTEDNLTRFAEVDKTSAPACLIEICFHDSTDDMRLFWQKRVEIVAGVRQSILEYFDL